MTPAARAGAAITLIDRIAAGEAAERALTNWARGARYAGSADRAALRDMVFDVLRRWDSTACMGGAATGRGRVLGLLRQTGVDPATIFTGAGHAPAPLSPEEEAAGAPPEGLAALDCPPWLEAPLRASLGAEFAPVMEALRHRAPVFLRVNTARTDREAAQAMLAAEGVETRPGPLAATVLEVTGNARKVSGTRAFAEGFVEVQDAASQAVVAALPLEGRGRVLDYCAGGGGKALAMAASAPSARVFAHDASPARMADLGPRAERAGARITPLATAELARAAPFDLVLVDAPCSGSGAWRRSPEAKWRLTPGRLEALVALQAEILGAASALVAPGGVLAYATCSLLDAENAARAAAFAAAHPGWRPLDQQRWTPLDGGDGFFLAQFGRD